MARSHYQNPGSIDNNGRGLMSISDLVAQGSHQPDHNIHSTTSTAHNAATATNIKGKATGTGAGRGRRRRGSNSNHIDPMALQQQNPKFDDTGIELMNGAEPVKRKRGRPKLSDTVNNDKNMNGGGTDRDMIKKKKFEKKQYMESPQLRQKLAMLEQFIDDYDNAHKATGRPRVHPLRETLTRKKIATFPPEIRSRFEEYVLIKKLLPPSKPLGRPRKTSSNSSSPASSSVATTTNYFDSSNNNGMSHNIPPPVHAYSNGPNDPTSAPLQPSSSSAATAHGHQQTKGLNSPSMFMSIRPEYKLGLE